MESTLKRPQTTAPPAPLIHERNFGLDLLRAMSILFVLFHHTYFIARQWGVVGYLFVGNGTLGVEIFFVLSGFLIFGILFKIIQRSEKFHFQDLRVFLIRRWYRTLPNYYFVLIVSIVVYMYFGFESKTHLFRYFTFTQTFFGYDGNFFTSSWSLATEEWSYILAAGLVATSIYYYYNSTLSASLSSAIVRSMVISLIGIKLINYLILLGRDTPGSWLSEVKYATFFHLDSILIGGILSYVYLNYRSQFSKWRIGKLMVGLVLILFASILQKKLVSMHNYYDQPFLSIGILPLMAVGIALTFPFFHGLRNKNKKVGFVVYWLSVLSYSLYLCNLQVVDLWKRFGGAPSWMGYIFLWVSFFVISIFLYHVIEKPFMSIRNRKFKQ